MKRRTRRPQHRKPGAGLADSASIDEQYALEPVIEPGGGSADGEESGGVQLQRVQCPYCGEHFDTQLDTSSGSTRYIEDCQVCCRPIEFCLEVDYNGVLAALTTLRSD